MRLVTVEDLRDGDILANDVLLEDYTVVLSSGTEIKQQYIDKLRELDIFTVYIQEKVEVEESETDVPTEPTKKEAASQEKKVQVPVEKKEAAKPSSPAQVQKTKKQANPPKEKSETAKSQETKREMPKPEKQDKKEQAPKFKKTRRIPLQEITILRDDVEKQIKNKIKDIIELHIYQKTEGLEKIAETAENIIADIIEEDEVVEKVYDVRERSADIYEHSLQVCTIATIIALKLGLSKEDVYDISVSSLIHDLGLRYLILRYENKDINIFSEKDQEEYKKHPIYGYTALKSEEWLSEKAKNIVLSHHERKDKSGYPLGTDMVTRKAQIVGVCDEFDEMICGIGKARVRVHEAINTIRNYSGIWFDDDIVTAFLQMIAVYPVGSRVMTNQGETAIVIKQNAHFPERPVLKIMADKYGQPLLKEKLVDLIEETSVVIQEVLK